MRRLIALILVAVMLVSCIVFTTGTSATETQEENVAANANYFGGTLIYKENSGSKGDSYSDPLTVKTGSAGTITLDGVIEEGEWGDKAVTVDSAFAANNRNLLGNWISGGSNYAMYQHPSAENTYFFGQSKAVNNMEFSYDLYFLWDEDFLYMAAHVNDPYNHQNVNQGADCWNGDALQFFVDPQGPNSHAAAEGVTYKYMAEHYIIHKVDEDGNELPDIAYYDNSPWNGLKDNLSSLYYAPVSNFIVAYSTAAGGYTEAWDAALRYYPEQYTYEYIDPATQQTVSATGTIYKTACISGEYADDVWTDMGVAAYATVRPTNLGSVREPNYKTDYEIAIPWEMINLANEDGTFQDSFVPGVGSELGITVACLNSSKPGTGDYDSWLSWGSGVCTSQLRDDYQTAGGSNCLTLSATGYKSFVGCDHTFAEANCIAPETCTKCGYQRGFETGHDYVCSDEILPTATADGSVKATCSVCGGVKMLTLGAGEQTRHFGFSETDTAIPEEMGPQGWRINWYDRRDDPYTPERDGQMLYYKDAQGNLKSKTSFDNWTFPGISVVDAATRGDGLYYVDGTPATIAADAPSSVIPEVTITAIDDCSQCGTYFDAIPFDYSYTLKLDVMPMDYTLDIPGHAKGLYLWYGGKVVDYMAGLFVFGHGEEDLTYVFAVIKTDTSDSYYNDLEKFEAGAEVYFEVPESVVKTGEWHQFVAMFDNNAQYVALYWDGQLMVSAHEPLMKYMTDKPYAIFRRMNVPFYAKNIDYGTTSYAATYFSGEETYTATIDGVEYQYEAGATVELSAANGAFYRDADDKALRFDKWTGEVEFADANAAATTFIMPAADVTVDSTYYLIGDLNGDGKVNVTDANLIKKMITGATDLLPAADINLDNKVNAQDANNLKAMVLGKFTPER